MTDESGDRSPRRSAVDVFYHPEHGTAVEIWDIGGDIAADVPGEGIVTGQQAAMVLNACLDSEDVNQRRINA